MRQAAMLGVLLAMLVTTGAGAARIDPHKPDRWRHAAPLAKSPEVVKHREGGDPGASIKAPGRDKYDPITLKRGVTQDTGFASWAASAKSGAHRHRHHP
jgi:phage tail-like protein